MAITALSKQSRQTHRRLENELREALICYMRDELGFPASSILKEKSLESISCFLPQTLQKPPLRRVDVAVTAPCKKLGLRLLLLVECKLDPFFDTALSQVRGYHHYLRSPFIWIVSEKRSELFSWESDGYKHYTAEPTYQHLLAYSQEK